MLRSLLENIETFRQSRTLQISHKPNGDLQITNSPPLKSKGLYWIYTNYTINDLKNCTPSPQESSINIAELAKLHENLTHVSQFSSDGFSLVYNGIATSDTLPLQKRIHQHFNGGEGNGCLSIKKSSLSNLSKWRITAPAIDTDDLAGFIIPREFAVIASASLAGGSAQGAVFLILQCGQLLSQNLRGTIDRLMVAFGWLGVRIPS
ncbi:hypothetical protein [Methylovulum psychrotolerans]|uniref:Uncharacterized protein n=1 Tax=Methylovulum psychrotolerans TaxID=1704499 RepID=A0A2S5CG00_9GAMM|nr:hypothetical protein [Methylovulum psychrotolerans]POZ49731.1 hypothetical protein AADEFJLK_04491 [Methylovulum psychrotolerans]